MAAVWAIVKLLPDILTLLKKVFVWTENGIDVVQTRLKMAELSKSVDKAKQTGDTSDVENMFRGGK